MRPAALDERGERGMEGSGGEVLHFLYSPTGGLLAEYDAATGAVTREYVSLAGQPLALIADGQVLAVHPGRLGAPQAMTDASGALVWQASLRPFGEAEDLFEAASNDQRFPGQRLDAETGLHQNWFRDYDPTLGRYLQADPIGLAGGLNVYAYAGGNPVNRIDPLGLFHEEFLRDFQEGGISFFQGAANLVTNLDRRFFPANQCVRMQTELEDAAILRLLDLLYNSSTARSLAFDAATDFAANNPGKVAGRATANLGVVAASGFAGKGPGALLGAVASFGTLTGDVLEAVRQGRTTVTDFGEAIAHGTIPIPGSDNCECPE